MKLATGLIAVILGASPSAAFCDPAEASPCDKPKTTMEMRACAADRLKNAEQELAQVQSTLLVKLTDDGQKKSYEASQEAWVSYRDAEASFEGSFYEGGTIQVQIRLDCMTRITQARVKELRQALSDASSQ